MRKCEEFLFSSFPIQGQFKVAAHWRGIFLKEIFHFTLIVLLTWFIHIDTIFTPFHPHIHDWQNYTRGTIWCSDSNHDVKWNLKPEEPHFWGWHSYKHTHSISLAHQNRGSSLNRSCSSYNRYKTNNCVHIWHCSGSLI